MGAGETDKLRRDISAFAKKMICKAHDSLAAMLRAGESHFLKNAQTHRAKNAPLSAENPRIAKSWYDVKKSIGPPKSYTQSIKAYETAHTARPSDIYVAHNFAELYARRIPRVISRRVHIYITGALERRLPAGLSARESLRTSGAKEVARRLTYGVDRPSANNPRRLQ